MFCEGKNSMLLRYSTHSRRMCLIANSVLRTSSAISSYTARVRRITVKYLCFVVLKPMHLPVVEFCQRNSTNKLPVWLLELQLYTSREIHSSTFLSETMAKTAYNALNAAILCFQCLYMALLVTFWYHIRETKESRGLGPVVRSPFSLNGG